MDADHLAVQPNGATNTSMSMTGLPPREDAKKEADEPKGITVRFPPAEMADYELIADLWNALDKVQGVQRSVKWKPTGLLRHAARELRDAVKKKFGEWPTDPSAADEREAFIRRIVEASKKQQGK